MTKYLALTRVNLQMALYQLSLVRRTTGRREGRGFQMGLAVIVLVIMVYWGFWSNQMTKSLGDTGAPWLTLVIGMLFVSFMIMGLGLYTFNSMLFESADTDQLFAMPLSKLTVLLGKVSGIVVENWIIGLVLWLPMVIVYGNYAHPAPLFYVFALVTLLIMPGVPLFILALISYLVGLLTSGGRWRKILQIVLTLGFMATIGFGLRSATAHLLATAKIDSSAGVQDALFALLQRLYPPVGYAIQALIAGSWRAMGLAILWNVLPFLAIATLIAASYAWIRSRITTVARVTGGHATYKSTSAARSLYGKELARLLGSPMYMLNSLIGALLTILFAFLFTIQTGKNAEGMRETLQQMGITLTPILLIVFLFMLSLANTTAPSISLEGKNLWIIQSMPVDAATVLRSKLAVHLTIIPAIVLVSCVISLFTVSVGGTGFVMLLVPCLVFTVVSACLGLIYNLHFHRFDFYNDMQVVKNSASVLLTMGTMVVVVAVATFGYWLLGRFLTVNLWAYWGVWVAILAVAAFVLYRHLMTRGVVMFEELGG